MIEKSFLKEEKFDVLNYFICHKGCMKFMKYRVSKKNTCSKSSLKIQEQKWRLVNKTLLQWRYL